MQFNPTHRLFNCPAPLGDQPYCDLSHPADFSDRNVLVEHIDRQLAASPHNLIWGGYLEHRNIYATSDHFYQEGTPRDIHLGIDIWTDAFTPIYAPLEGVIHSFQDNAGFSNYGPTILLEHSGEEGRFYILYGHLSRRCLAGLKPGQEVPAGTAFCELGPWEENGDWPPHLHFQLILDLGDWWGDYPGACTQEKKAVYALNCPDPSGFLI